MANRKVRVVRSVKLDGKWKFLTLERGRKLRIPNSEGRWYISWREGSRTRWERAKDSGSAYTLKLKKDAELHAAAFGVQIVPDTPARLTVENSRSAMTNAGLFNSLMDLSPLLADLLRVEGSIRAAQQGYTGFTPAVRVNPQQLDRLYEYDYGFAQAADTLNQTIAALPGLIGGPSPNPSAVPGVLTTARTQLTQLEAAFKARLNVVEGIQIS